MTDTTERDVTQVTSRKTPEPAGPVDGTDGKVGFRHMLAQAMADLENVHAAQDRAIASLELIRARPEAGTGGDLLEGLVSSMQGHLSVGKSEVRCDIDTLRMIAPVLHVSKNTVQRDLKETPDELAQLAHNGTVGQESGSDHLAHDVTVEQDSAAGDPTPSGGETEE